jgi:hypothetical protein
MVKCDTYDPKELVHDAVVVGVRGRISVHVHVYTYIYIHTHVCTYVYTLVTTP